MQLVCCFMEDYVCFYQIRLDPFCTHVTSICPRAKDRKTHIGNVTNALICRAKTNHDTEKFYSLSFYNLTFENFGYFILCSYTKVKLKVKVTL